MIEKIKSNIYIIASVFLVIIFILGALSFSNSNSKEGVGPILKADEVKEYADNVRVENGKQIIKLVAKGGFSPVHSIAKAGIPTILRITTEGTFDCSSVVRIPKLDISRNLPMSGTTDIDIGSQEVGTVDGTCGMGMYPFDLKFE